MRHTEAIKAVSKVYSFKYFINKVWSYYGLTEKRNLRVREILDSKQKRS